MELGELQKHWNTFGETDPLWAILTIDAKRHGKWDVGEFFEMGRIAIANVLGWVDSLGVDVPRGKALDFGCGVGRLTQALCGHFRECHGVDIAPSMVGLAREYNAFGDRCHYHLNEAGDLQLFGDDTFDFVFSDIALQHMRPEYSRVYIREFLRILAPGGLVVFQLPSEFVPVEYARDRKKVGPGWTIATAGLPESGFKARIAAIDPPGALTAGARATVRVRVTNLGDATWPVLGAPDGRYRIRLGNHWRGEAPGAPAFEDARGELPRDVRPRDEVEIPLHVTAPAEPGRYSLELDMVQEGIAWFRDRGNAPARCPVKVKGARRRLSDLYRKALRLDEPSPGPSPFVPIMEMYYIEKDEVIRHLEQHGGTVVGVMEDKTQGDHCVSYFYAVTK